MEAVPPMVEAMLQEAARLGFSPSDNIELRILAHELQVEPPLAFGWFVFDGNRHRLVTRRNSSIDGVFPLADRFADCKDLTCYWYEEGRLERVDCGTLFEKLYRLHAQLDTRWETGDQGYRAWVDERVAALRSLCAAKGMGVSATGHAHSPIESAGGSTGGEGERSERMGENRVALVEELMEDYTMSHRLQYSPDAYLSAEKMFEELQAYKRALCLAVQEEARKRGVAIHLYLLAPQRENGQAVGFTVSVDGVEALSRVSRSEARAYVLERIHPEDLYCGNEQSLPETGQALREGPSEPALESVGPV